MTNNVSPQPQYDGTSAKELLSRAQKCHDINQLKAMYEHAEFKLMLLQDKGKTMRARLWRNTCNIIFDNEMPRALNNKKKIVSNKKTLPKAKTGNKVIDNDRQAIKRGGATLCFTIPKGLSARTKREFHKEKPHSPSSYEYKLCEYDNWRGRAGLTRLSQMTEDELENDLIETRAIIAQYMKEYRP